MLRVARAQAEDPGPTVYRSATRKERHVPVPLEGERHKFGSCPTPRIRPQQTATGRSLRIRCRWPPDRSGSAPGTRTRHMAQCTSRATVDDQASHGDTIAQRTARLHALHLHHVAQLQLIGLFRPSSRCHRPGGFSCPQPFRGRPQEPRTCPAQPFAWVRRIPAQDVGGICSQNHYRKRRSEQVPRPDAPDPDDSLTEQT